MHLTLHFPSAPSQNGLGCEHDPIMHTQIPAVPTPEQKPWSPEQDALSPHIHNPVSGSQRFEPFVQILLAHLFAGNGYIFVH